MYTLRIYQNYCSVMYIYGDNHDFMFPFFKQHLSHIYDTLTFKFKCQRWGGGGGGGCFVSHNPPPPPPPLTFKSYL